MLKPVRLLAVMAPFLASACTEEPPTTAQESPKPPPPKDETRPADPGLSFDPPCPTTIPMPYDIKLGSRPDSGIPAVTDPEFLAAAEATYLQDPDYVFGVEIDGRFLAFPARILNYHEVTNYSLDLYRYAATW